IGRPKSATFRTLDLVGLDVFAQVARNLHERLPPEARRRFMLPALIAGMIERGWIGDKAGQGFYKRERSAAGFEISVLDPATMTYRPRQPVKLPSLDAARSVESVADRIKMLFGGRDKVGDFLCRTLAPTLAFASAVAPSIAISSVNGCLAVTVGMGWY